MATKNRRNKKVNISAFIRSLVSTHPEISTETVQKRMETKGLPPCSPTLITTVRKNMQKKMAKESVQETNGHAEKKSTSTILAEHSSLPKNSGMMVRLQVPTGGLTVQLTVGVGNKQRVVGTLDINKDGLAFRKASGKRKTERRLNWAMLQHLAELGLLV